MSRNPPKIEVQTPVGPAKVAEIKVVRKDGGESLCVGWEAVKPASEGALRCKAGMRVACAYHTGTVAASVGVWPA